VIAQVMPFEPEFKPARVCDVHGCGKPYVAKGFCGMHYKRKFVYGISVEIPQIKRLWTSSEQEKLQMSYLEYRKTGSLKKLAKELGRTRQFICRQAGKIGLTSPSHPKHGFQSFRSPRGRGSRRSDLGDKYFRSSWEANYARYLNWLKQLGEIEKWEYEAETFWFESIKRGSRCYTPDFKVWEKGYIHYDEIKGWMDPKSATKLARMRRFYPLVDVRVIGPKEYRELHFKVSGLIPGWERISGHNYDLPLRPRSR
jgi:hypothetical protein